MINKPFFPKSSNLPLSLTTMKQPLKFNSLTVLASFYMIRFLNFGTVCSFLRSLYYMKRISSCAAKTH